MSEPNEASMINQLAKASLKSQFETIDQLSVEVETSASALANGEVESITIDGEGLSSKDQQLRTDQLRVETGAIAINPWKAIVGNIELKDPVDAIAHMSFTFADMNEAVSREEFRCAVEQELYEKFHQSLTVEMIHLSPESSLIRLHAKFSGEQAEEDIEALLEPQISEGRLLFNLKHEIAQQNLMIVLLNHLKPLFQLDSFVSGNATSNFTEVTLSQDRLALDAKIEISELSV